MAKLHELLAVRDDRSNKAKKIVDETRHVLGHNRNLFAGTVKTVRAHDDKRSKEFDSDETISVTTSVQARLEYTFGAVISAIDVAATIAQTNTIAKADIVVDGVTLKTNVPATTLLELEKELTQWRETVNLCPTLPSGIDWIPADNQAIPNVFVTKHPIVKKRSEKVTTPVVLYAHTDKHPAQVKEVVNDVPVADITETAYNAMLKSETKAAMLERVDKLIVAVKEARARANDTEAQFSNVGKVLADYVLKGA
jgi:hypothetical protein